MLSILTVFHWDIWLTLILGTLLACAICGVLFMNQAEDTDSWLRSFNLVGRPRYDCLVRLGNISSQVLCSLLNRDTSFDFVPELTVSGKIFSFSMLTGGYLLLSAYCAVLISYLTVDTYVLPFDSIEGLIESDYELAEGQSANLQFMKDAPEGSCKFCTYT